ncbi:hypothetical protein FXF51_11920 [Nonomuraea sp. PA05]|uniref:hypothetical protein n=1 Tax=Nonomuraea sp. PA05 TaxID=2604466 RepID=UPI0011DB6DE9|nr:hypothetical protein [Nonomuraea sp. PA05]TYB68530.1 hypothetical protein FXF51_11920 [Nonomuraea sp. PA05]
MRWKGRWAGVVCVLVGGTVALLGVNGGIGSKALLGVHGEAHAGGGQDRAAASTGPGGNDGGPGATGPNGGTAATGTTGVTGANDGAGANGGTGANGADASAVAGDGGTVGTGPEASAEARMREVQRPQAQQPAPTPGRTTGGTVTGALPGGTTSPEDVLAGGPPPEDGVDYRADGPSRHTDHQAAEYFSTNWGPNDKTLKHLKDVRSVGGYLRIYTDLPETADNSLTAIILCERGLAYLRSRGVEDPVVFVQAEFGGNGNPVLANIIGPGDRSCRVTHPAPG